MGKVKVVVHLKDVLAARGITQAQLSEMAKLRPAAISEFANNVRSALNTEHISKIATALGITDIRELLTLEEVNYNRHLNG